MTGSCTVYNILLDCVLQNYTGAVKTEDYQQPLYAIQGMEDGPHTVTLTNAADAFLDFDFAMVTVRVGSTARDMPLLILRAQTTIGNSPKWVSTEALSSAGTD